MQHKINGNIYTYMQDFIRSLCRYNLRDFTLHMHIAIKTHNSESRGQEEAATTE